MGRPVRNSDSASAAVSSQRVKDTGKRFTMTFALHLTIEDGLISRHLMYEDSLAVMEAFTGCGALDERIT
ncbi:hypothetical protein GCM10010404_60240 [Nonomuraea africana]